MSILCRRKSQRGYSDASAGADFTFYPLSYEWTPSSVLHVLNTTNTDCTWKSLNLVVGIYDFVHTCTGDSILHFGGRINSFVVTGSFTQINFMKRTES